MAPRETSAHLPVCGRATTIVTSADRNNPTANHEEGQHLRDRSARLSRTSPRHGTTPNDDFRTRNPNRPDRCANKMQAPRSPDPCKTGRHLSTGGLAAAIHSLQLRQSGLRQNRPAPAIACSTPSGTASQRLRIPAEMRVFLSSESLPAGSNLRTSIRAPSQK